MDMLLSEAVQKATSNEFAKSVLESEKFGPMTDSQKETIIQLIENTQIDIQKTLSEGTLTGDVAQFTPIIIPMIRRIYPNLIANELLGVQPMSMPTGFIYALVNQYLGDGLKKVDDRPKPAGVIYQVSLTDADKIKAAVQAGTVQTSTSKILDSTAAERGYVLYIEDDKILATVDVDNTPNHVNQNLNVGDTFDIGTAVTGLTVTAVYTNESSFGHILKNFTGPYKTVEAEHLGDEMREVGFSISRKPIAADSRALKGKYTVELYQDLKAQHGLTADEELMSLMQYEIQAEIDREIVDFVKDNSTWLPDTVFGAQTNVQVPDGRWEIERYRAQTIRIAKESAIIGLDTKRGQGNILLVSPMVATMLEQVGSFQLAPTNSDIIAPVSGGVAGVFDNRYKVVIDQYAKDDFCTVLYKGANSRDAMGFFCPYVPLSFTKVTDYVTGQPVIIAKTRYALATTPGVSDPKSNDRAKTYARSFGVNFANSVLARQAPSVLAKPSRKY